MREVQRKRQAPDFAPDHPKAVSDLMMWLERAERIRTQQRFDKNKLYALHAPEVECIGKGKARKPYEFGVKSAVVVSHKHGLMLGARTFRGNPYDGHILSAALEQVTNLTQDLPVKLKHIVVDLGFRGVDADNPDKQIIHRGKFKSLSPQQKGWLRRRQAVEPAIGHLKSGSPDGPLLAARRTRRRAAFHQLCCRLQPALADARDRRSAGCRWPGRGVRLSIALPGASTWRAATFSRHRGVVDERKMNFAGWPGGPVADVVQEATVGPCL